MIECDAMPSNTKPNSIIQNCLTWAHFVQAVSSLSKIEKGRAFERLTQLYLQTKPEYQTTLKDVWRLADVPVKVKRKLRSLPTADEGIDLIAETRTGEFWAIQCKYKSDKDKALTVKELSTFTNLAFNVCAGTFSQALVAHSTNKPVRKQKLLGNTTEIGLQRWLELSEEEWRLIQAKLRNESPRPLKRSPRPHQQQAIEAAKSHFLDKKESRGKLLMPCGTGKSLTAFWIAQALNSKLTLVVVPSLSLVKQSVEDWTRELVAQNVSPLPEWLCVCSDQSVGKVSKDEFVESVYDLGLPVTTNEKEIRAFLKRQSPAQRIVFVTYQSSPIFAEAARQAKAKIDLAILDEAHKTAGEKSKSFSTLLFDKNVKIQRRMFMTATERVMRGSDDEVVSMDDPDIYGKCIYHLSFKEAIHSQPSIISDYKVLTVFVTENEIQQAIQEQKYITDAKSGIEAQDARYLAAAIALRKAYRQFEIKHAVSFHRSIRAASDFADLHRNLNSSKSLRPKIDCFHISSQKTAGERTELLRDFASSNRSLITNAKCLTEGVDVPAIDCVLFADPKQSTVDIVQAAGRALRPYSGKKYGYIMLPIIVPDGMSFEEFADSTEFRAVSKVITSLSTQDERIAEEFRVSKNAKSSKESIIQFSGTVPSGMKFDLDEFAAAVSAKVWQRVAKAYWRPFNEAREHVRSLKLKSLEDWKMYANSGKRPADIPLAPQSVYKNEGWKGVGDWLGTGTIATFRRKYLPFKQARAFARSLNLKSWKEWIAYARSDNRPRNIPVNPNHVYNDEGWNGMGDWLGTGRNSYHDRAKLPFEQARAFARSLNLKSVREWNKYAKSGSKPEDIPASPRGAYKNEGWKGMGDWLGTGHERPNRRIVEARSFAAARKFARSLNLKSWKEWEAFSKSDNCPNDIPLNPNITYKNKGWKGNGDWLGTERVSNRDRKYLPFEEARAFARSLNLPSKESWITRTQRADFPKDIPAKPSRKYKENGWNGWSDWLGTGRVSSLTKLPFEQARDFARSLNLKSAKDWTKYTKSGAKPNDIPIAPDLAYKNKGWVNWGDWLGTGTIATANQQALPFEQARDFARSLNLKSETEWRLYLKHSKPPKGIPTNPQRTYKEKGWKGMADWLGKK